MRAGRRAKSVPKKYEVESISAERTDDGVREYLVNWKGYVTPSWETADVMDQQVPDVVASFKDSKDVIVQKDRGKEQTQHQHVYDGLLASEQEKHDSSWKIDTKQAYTLWAQAQSIIATERTSTRRRINL